MISSQICLNYKTYDTLLVSRPVGQESNRSESKTRLKKLNLKGVLAVRHPQLRTQIIDSVYPQLLPEFLQSSQSFITLMNRVQLVSPAVLGLVFVVFLGRKHSAAPEVIGRVERKAQ